MEEWIWVLMRMCYGFRHPLFPGNLASKLFWALVIHELVTRPGPASPSFNHCKVFPPLLQCFVFHLHTGVRAGGGIGDEIESADGDASEVSRILFDISFFFFVIVILLAIIQGTVCGAGSL